MPNRFAKLCLPPDLKMPEHLEEDGNWEALYDSLQRTRKRWGELTDALECFHRTLVTVTSGALACQCFRWIWTGTAVVAGQTIFQLPVANELEDNEYQLVWARDSFMYHTADYTINLVTNTLTLTVGIPAGEAISIYALRHDDIQEVYYEVCAVPAAPYLFSPPVTIDRAPGRQLVMARTSFRFYHSGRLGDEYTVSDTSNQLSLTAGLGPADERACVVRLKSCGVIFHEEILATVAGQTIFTPNNPGNRFVPHATGKLIVAARTSFRHPHGYDYVVDTAANTLTLNAPGVGLGDPLNVWVFR